MTIDDDLFENVANYIIARKVWDALIIIYEGTKEVRENKQALLTQQYEMYDLVSIARA